MEKAVNLRTVNNYLTVVIIGLALYVMVYPLLPNIVFWWNSFTNTKPPLVAANAAQDSNEKSPPEDIPKDNMLVIPSLNMQEVVYEGTTEAALDYGAWRRPLTSDPSKGGNTVIAGHRFTYRGAAVFYNLDKIKVGDRIIMYWNGKKHRYTVTRTYVVPPTEVQIERPADTPTLTLYTCTPLWTSKNRLVVEAKLVEQS